MSRTEKNLYVIILFVLVFNIAQLSLAIISSKYMYAYLFISFKCATYHSEIVPILNKTYPGWHLLEVWNYVLFGTTIFFLVKINRK